MRWDDLQFFAALARKGALAAAARQLNVDATTVGRRLRRLEEELGEILFEQKRDGQMLTEAGRRLLAHVEAMEKHAAAIRSAAAGPGEVSGRLRISVSEGFGGWVIADHLHEFAAAYPQVEIDLVANSGFLDLSRREADVAILLARPRSGPLICRKLTDYNLRLYASEAYLERAEPIRSRADLTRHPIIGYVPDLLYSDELQYMSDILPGLAAQVRSTSINAQYRMVRAGAGVGVLHGFMGDRDPRLSRILPELVITRTFWLATHRDTRRQPRTALFVDWLVDLVERRRDWLLS